MNQFVESLAFSSSLAKLTVQVPIVVIDVQTMWGFKKHILYDSVGLSSMNIACKGWSRFCHPEGLSGEDMRGTRTTYSR